MSQLDETEAIESARLLAAALPDNPPLTRYRDPADPVPTGAQPVPQPGRPPMSQAAVDHSTIVLAYGIASVPVGGVTSLALWTLAHVPPVVLVAAGFVPMGLAAATAVVCKVAGRAAKDVAEALPPGEQHAHFEGPTTVYVDRTETHTHARGFGRATTQLPGREQR